MFFSHTTGELGIGHVTKRLAVAFVVSAPPTTPPPHPSEGTCFFLFWRGLMAGLHTCASSWRPKVKTPWILQALNFHSAMQLLTPIEGKAVISRHFFFYRGVLLLMVWPYFSLLALAKKSKVTSLLRFTWQSIWKFSKQLCHHEKWIWTLLRNFITEFLNQWYYNSSTGICKEKRKNETGQL